MKLTSKLTIFFVFIVLFLPIFAVQSELNFYPSTKMNQSSNLIIYTYDSLMADPQYDIIGNFSSYSSMPRENIQITRFEDANELVARLTLEKDNPVADVVIGIDNALIHSVEKSSLLQKYQPIPFSDLDQSLVENLDPEGYLWPYDYGIISLFYQNQVINETTDPVLKNLTLESLANSGILGKLIIQNPQFSSPGLGFLLWTIAVYGDPQKDITGLLGSDWRVFWEKAGKEVNITKSWGDAFTIFFEPEENKPIMVSYGTSPAYGYCLWGDDSTSAILTHENDTTNAWLQIEGIGLVKNAPNGENGKTFIDWFLGSNLQSQIPMSQWMYPANTEAEIPDCFNQASINPNSVNILNSIINPKILKDYLKTWQDEWEILIVDPPSVYGFELPSFLLVSITSAVISITHNKRKKKF